MNAKFQRIHEKAKMPSKGALNDAGWDVYATEKHVIVPGGRVVIGLGLIWEPELHEGEKDYIWEIQVRPKSGLAKNDGITVLNSPGTIDQEYRDEIGVLIINHSGHEVVIEEGQKVAQFVFKNLPKVTVEDAIIDLKKANRGGGWGSTSLY